MLKTAISLSNGRSAVSPIIAVAPISFRRRFVASSRRFKLENLQTQGISLPRLGLGTFRMQGDVCRAAVESALKLGYRHIDTAEMYANEEAIGAALAGSGVARG